MCCNLFSDNRMRNVYLRMNMNYKYILLIKVRDEFKSNMFTYTMLLKRNELIEINKNLIINESKIKYKRRCKLKKDSVRK